MAARVFVDVLIALVVSAATVFFVERFRRSRRSSDGTPALVSAAANTPPPQSTFDLVPPHQLPTFAAVGDLDGLKDEMRSTVGLLIANPDEARRYRITWNGLLFHGPPGVGKSFFVRALAGELRANLVTVATADLVTGHPGAGPSLVEEAFQFAAAHVPCVLFFEEFDAVAEARDSDASARDVLAQLLRSVEDHRDNPRLVIAASTNAVEDLDPAIVRPGRFDRQVRLDLPDAAARAAIFKAALYGRPVAKDVDVDTLCTRTRGQSPAAICQVVEGAALAAFREAAGTGKRVRISTAMLLDAVERRGGRDRPTVEDWSWDRLVLPSRTLAELHEIEALVRDPEESERLGVDVPAGILLTGPPGTGKTTIAKVLAAESRCSFYPVTVTDLTSRWVGESERRVAHLFARARANAPSIVFVDEIDAVGSKRGDLQTYDRQLDQLLAEIDGMSDRGRVLVVGATNRLKALDPALLRGGRLSRVIEIPLPDVDLRRAILATLTERMPLGSVDLDDLALETEGFSGGDLKAMCQQAAVEAMIRQHAEHGPESGPNILAKDFEQALAAGPVHSHR